MGGENSGTRKLILSTGWKGENRRSGHPFLVGWTTKKKKKKKKTSKRLTVPRYLFTGPDSKKARLSEKSCSAGT